MQPLHPNRTLFGLRCRFRFHNDLQHVPVGQYPGSKPFEIIGGKTFDDIHVSGQAVVVLKIITTQYIQPHPVISAPFGKGFCDILLDLGQVGLVGTLAGNTGQFARYVRPERIQLFRRRLIRYRQLVLLHGKGLY